MQRKVKKTISQKLSGYIFATVRAQSGLWRLSVSACLSGLRIFPDEKRRRGGGIPEKSLTFVPPKA